MNFFLLMVSSEKLKLQKLNLQMLGMSIMPRFFYFFYFKLELLLDQALVIVVLYTKPPLMLAYVL